MHSAHGLPKYAISLETEIQQVIHWIVKINIFNDIKPKSAVWYPHIVIGGVNKDVTKTEGQKISRRGLIKCQASATRGKGKAISGWPGWCTKRYVKCITISITKNQGIILCFSQACQKIYKPTKKCQSWRIMGWGWKKSTWLQNINSPSDLNEIWLRARQV